MHCGGLSRQYGRLSSFTTCWWAGGECRAAVMYGMYWWSRERRAAPNGSSAFASVASLHPFTISRTCARGAVLPLHLLWSLLVSPYYFHTFYFFIRLLTITRLSLTYFSLSAHAVFSIQAELKKICFSVFTCSTISVLNRRSVLYVNKSTIFRQILSFKFVISIF